MNIKVEKEHDPSTCSVCARLGDWTTQADTEEWFEEHANVMGIRLNTVDGPTGSRITEEKVDVAECKILEGA